MTVTQRLSAFVPRTTIIGALAAAALLFGALAATRASEPAVVLPPPAVDVSGAQDGEQVAVIAGGCFWGVQAVFQHTEGVIQATSGYSGGTRQSANYDAVSGGRSDHAEAVQVRFDPKKISYGKILQIFFSVAHDPTQLNRQGPDVGPQYRTAIFYSNDEQKRVTEAYIRQLDGLKVYKKPIVTRVGRLDAFYPAEAYHQDYATLNPNQPYIRSHDRPKIENLKRLMPEVYRDKPVLVRAAAAASN
jgi:peptide-methionine (S)-S-oxide reductase